MRRVRKDARPTIDKLEPEAVGILEACWGLEPENRMSFSDLFEYIQANKYELVPDVHADEVARYVARIEEYESRFPAVDLRSFDEEE
jgi:hypothetical protein